MNEIKKLKLDRDSAFESIEGLSEEDLQYLNRIIIERLKHLSQARSTVQLSRFTVGDRVSFRSPSGKFIVGVIEKLNKKSATILTQDGNSWNVSPGFLSLEGK